MFPDFKEFRKIPRFSREIIITEKIDGANGLIYIDYAGEIFAGSRNRWLWGSIQDEIHNDNHGFAHWVKTNKDELMKLGPGYHYGEFWGLEIQRRYGLQEKRFSLFNIERWKNNFYFPRCCSLVPLLYIGPIEDSAIEDCLIELKEHGSKAAPGYMNPEGIVIYHSASRSLFKKTILDDEKWKNSNE